MGGRRRPRARFDQLCALLALRQLWPPLTDVRRPARFKYGRPTDRVWMALPSGLAPRAGATAKLGPPRFATACGGKRLRFVGRDPGFLLPAVAAAEGPGGGSAPMFGCRWFSWLGPARPW